jgi:peptide/nickel transport system substrate-binding protein
MSEKRLTRGEFIRIVGAVGLTSLLAANDQVTPAAAQTTPAPTAAPAAGVPISGGTLIDARVYETLGIDPHSDMGTEACQKLAPMMYDCLVAPGPNLELKPQIAQKWDWSDDHTIVFTMRPGVKFSDGTPVTVDDVTYSYQRIMDPKTGAPAARYLKNVDSVSALNSTQVQFKLKSPQVSFPNDQYWSYIVPQSVKDKPQDFLKKNVIGTGPFTLQDWQPDVQMKLVRNNNYWQPGLPYLDGITIRIIKDEGTIIAGLRTGDIDLSTLEDPNNFELLKSNPNINLSLTPSNGPLFMNFNSMKPPMDDINVRQAMSQALDRNEFVKIVGAGLGSISGSIPPAFSDIFVPPDQLPFYNYDPDAAKALLQQSSMPNGFELEVLYITTLPIMKNSAELCKQFWDPIGIQCTLNGMETNVWANTISNTRDFQFTTNLDLGGPSPESIFVSMACGSDLAKFYGPCFSDMDAMVSTVSATTDPAQRKAIWKDLQVFAAQNLPNIWTFARTHVVSTQKWVQGFLPWPDKQHRGWEVVWLNK